MLRFRARDMGCELANSAFGNMDQKVITKMRRTSFVVLVTA